MKTPFIKKSGLFTASFYHSTCVDISHENTEKPATVTIQIGIFTMPFPFCQWNIFKDQLNARNDYHQY
jgi:hypothetical protein